MRLSTLAGIVLGVAVALAGCAPAQRPAEQGPVTAPDAARPKSLVIGVPLEPGPLISSVRGAERRVSEDLGNAVHQHLSTYDDQGALHPMLAAELPSVAAGTWVTRPDGTMQTTYRLRPNVTWHDGAPFTARDVVFAWGVTKDPDGGMSERSIARLIDRIEAPNDTTLVIEWSALYPLANAITQEDLGPFPVHLLEALYRSDGERFRNSSYWTTEFVGLGPFALAEWELGSHLTLKAYERFYGGRPKLDSIIVRFLSDSSVVVANLLAGSVDGANPNAMTFQEALFVKEEWERSGRKSLGITQSTHWRFLHVQFRTPARPEMTNREALAGFLHAIDRRAVADALFAGQAPVSDTFIPPSDPKWDWVKDVVATYPYDPARAARSFEAVGWRRAGDGGLVDAAGQRVGFPLWTETARSADEIALIAEYWKALGIDVEQVVLSPGVVRDRRSYVSFPGFLTSQGTINYLNLARRTHSIDCPTEENRWLPANNGCYRNPTMDALTDSLSVAIDPGEQRRLLRDVVRLQSLELPVLPLYFLVRMTLFREGVVGVKGDTSPRTGLMWNVAEWDVR